MSAACPKCGSESGYVFTMRLIEDRVGSFGSGGGDEEAGETRILGSEPRTAVCLSCKRRLSLAECRAGTP